MHPILFRLGSYVVYTYTTCLVAGMIAGTWTACRAARDRLPDPSTVLDAGFWGLLGGLLGGRAGYVVANWAYYADHLDKAFALWEGGLAWHGAWIAGCAFTAIWFSARAVRVLRRQDQPSMPGWRDLADAIAPGMALGGAFSWLGCLLAGCAYGAEAGGYAPPLSWLAADLPDIYGVEEMRFVTQPLMIAWCLLLWALLWGLRRRLRRGSAFGLYLLLYALADFGVAFLRGDGTWRLGLWLSQWFSLVEVCMAIGFILYVAVRVPTHQAGRER